MMTENTKKQLECTLNNFEILKRETAYTLTIIEDKREKHIYDLCLDLLCTLNKLESQYEEIGKLQYLINQANFNQEIDQTEEDEEEEEIL